MKSFKRSKDKESTVVIMAKVKKETSKTKNAEKALVLGLIVIVAAFAIAVSFTDEGDPELGAEEGGTIRYHPYVDSEEIIKVASGSSYVLPNNWFVGPKGEEFLGWDIDGTLYQPGTTITVTSNVEITPSWYPYVTLKFESGEGSGSMADMSIKPGVTKFPNNGFTAPVAKPCFAGWLLGDTVYSPGDTIPTDKGTTAVAQWAIFSSVTIRTVSFNDSGLTGSMDPIKVVDQGYIILPNCDFEKTGKVFTGWQISGVSGTHNIGERIQITSDKTLTPTWGTWDNVNHSGVAEDDTPIVRIWFDTTDSYFYNGDNKTNTKISVLGSMGPFYVKKGTTYLTPDNEFKNNTDSSLFKLWDIYTGQDTSKDDPSVNHYFNKQAGFEISIPADAVYNSIRIAIGWQNGTASISYDGNGGKSTMGGGGIVVPEYEESAGYPYSTSYSYVFPNNFFVREGYAFDHWNLSKNGGSPSAKYPGQTIEIGSKSGSYKLTAVWVETANTIVLKEGAAGSDYREIKTNVNYVVPNCSFGYAEHVFSYWSGNDGNSYNPGDVLSYKDVILTAIWDESPGKTLTFPDGQTPKTWSIKTDQKFILPSSTINPSAGKVFSCWESSGDMYSPGDIITVNSDMTFTAVWKDVVSPFVTISYELDGGTGPAEESKVRAGTPFILPSSGYEKSGSIFSGWSINEVYHNPDSVITITEDTTLVANWVEDDSDSIIFYADKSRGSMSVETSSAYTLPACAFPAPIGKEFYKWSVSIHGSQAVEKAAGESITVVDYAVVTPLWTTPIQVEFEAGGGSEEMPAMDAISGVSVYPNCDFEAPNSKMFFEGWYVNGTLHQPGDTIEYTSDIIAIAQWDYGYAKDKDIVRVTFSSNGGSGSMETMVLVKGTDFIIPNCAYTKAGTKFLKWEVSYGNTIQYRNANDFYSKIPADLHLRPIWESEVPSERSVEIQFSNVDCYRYEKSVKTDDKIESTGTMASYYVKEGVAFRLPDNEYQVDPGVNNLQFKCWAIYKDGQQISFDLHPGDQYTVTGNIVIKPCWQYSDDSRVVEYHGDGGITEIVGPLIDKPYSLGWKYVLPNNFFNKEGYVFNNWKYELGSETAQYLSAGTQKQGIKNTDLDLTAQWIQVASIITLDPGDGEGYPQTIFTNANYILPNCSFEREGFVFSHWEIDDDIYYPGDVINTKNNKDPQTVIAVAKWTTTESAITFKDGEVIKSVVHVGTGSHYILPINKIEVPEGEEFDCWEVNGERKRPGQVITVSDNVDVIVVWIIDPYVTVSFNGGDGSVGSMKPVDVKNGSSYILPHPIFSKTGYAFSNWLIGDVPHYIGESVTFTKDTKIVAQWESGSPVTVSFTDNDLDSNKVYTSDGTEAVVVPISSYYGLKSTEYNPEYWKGSGEVSSETNNWAGPLAKNRVDADVNMDVTFQYGLSGDYTIKLDNGDLVRNIINKITVGNTTIYPGETKEVSTKNRTSNVSLSWDGHYFTFNNSSNSADELLVSLDITVQMNYHKVFGGWVTASGDHVLPGDVVEWAVEDLYATWVTPDVFVPEKDTINLSNVWLASYAGKREYVMDVITPYANLNGINKTLQPVLMNYDDDTRTYEDDGQDFGNYAYVIPGKGHEYEVSRDGPDMYGTIYHLARERTYNESSASSKGYYNMDLLNGTPYDDRPTLGYLPAGSYRQPDNSVGVVKIVFKGGNQPDIYKCVLGGNVIIDNIGIDGDGNGGKNGYAPGSALYANGHILIMGAGLTNPDAGAAGSWNPATEKGAIGPQIFGGTYMADLVEPVIEKKTIVFSEVDKPTENLKVDLGSCIIVHSGIYHTIIGGSFSNSSTHYVFGIESKPLSTYMVLKGGTTTDTVAGGMTGTTVNSTLYGSIEGGSGRLDGGTFVYLLDHFMPADNWEDMQCGYGDYKSRSTYSVAKSTILEGGSTASSDTNYVTTIKGSTHIFLSGTSNIWDVQAGGRTEETHADYAYMEISGRAVIRHAACGTITDGAHKADVNAVNEVDIRVGGDSTVASIFGAGYDTYFKPTYKSMLSGNISIKVLGGHIGNVYGGGYRGSVGDGDLTININILGGTIEENVYGGGSGGLDKIGHNNEGMISTNYGPEGLLESMGRSIVIGDINVTIGGTAVVKGNVYGGGKSAPMLKDTILVNGGKNVNFNPTSSWQEGSVTVEVADVIGDVVVNIEGSARIGGSVYGGGRGIEHKELSDSYTIEDVDSMLVIKRSNGGYDFGTIRWFIPSSSATNYTLDTDNWINPSKEDNSRYLNFAKVHGNTKVVVNGTDCVISGDVFGGSAYGRVENSTFVDIKKGTVTNVYGGGLGREGLTSTTGNRTVWIEGTDGDYEELSGAKRIYGVSILGSVYGGSKTGNDATEGNERNALVVVSRGYIEDSVYGGGFVGKTYGSTDVNIGYYFPSGNVIRPIPMDYTGKDNLVFTRILSVFAGGNVNDAEEAPYEDYLVMNGGSINVFGNNTGAISIGGGYNGGGSIMGSGNACLTKGDTSIYLQNFYNASPLAGIHRATTLTLDNCNIKVDGMSPKTDVFGQNKDVSVYHIGTLILKNSSSLAFEDPIDDIGTLKSLTKEDQPTTEKTPENRFVFQKGNTIYIRSLSNPQDPTSLSYNEVEGFAMMVSTSGNYGAYAIALAGSPGGFSITADGTMREADTSVSEDGTCCWYVSGIQRKIVTLTLVNNNGNWVPGEGYFSVMKFQPDTEMIYAGGTFTKMSNDPNGDPYAFVRPGSESMIYEPSNLGLAIGYDKIVAPEDTITLYDPTLRLMDIGNGDFSEHKGTFYLKDGKESDIDENRDRSLTSVPMSYSSNDRTAGEFYINLCLMGDPIDATSYVGYLILNFEEVKEISYGAIDEDGKVVETPRYLVAGTIEVRVDLYISGSSAASSSNFIVDIKTDTDGAGKHTGSSSTLIPPSYTLEELNLVDVSLSGPGSGFMPNVYVTSGSSYTLPLDCGYIPPEGKTFDKWNVNGVNKEPGEEITVTGPLVIKPVWTDAAVLFYDAKGGTLKKNDASLLVSCGIRYQLPNEEEIFAETPSEDDIVFKLAKWSVTIDSKDEVIRYPGDIIEITGDTVIKAVWSPKNTITYKSGSGASVVKDVPYGERIVLDDCTFEYGDNHFLNWTVEIGEDSYTKYPGDKVYVSNNVIATANWSSGSAYRITFDENGGSGDMLPEEVSINARYKLPSCDFYAPTNLCFYKWAVSINGGPEYEYLPGQYVVITGNTIVKAIWNTKATLSFNLDIEEESPFSVELALGSEYHILSQFRPSGHTFLFYETGSHDKYYAGQIITITGDLSLTAISEPSTPCMIIFDANGGSGHMPMLERVSSSYYTLPNSDYVAAKGKVFDYWEVNGVEKHPGDSIQITGDVVIRAKWDDSANTDRTITIKETADSTSFATYVVKDGSTFILPSIPFDAPESKMYDYWEGHSGESSITVSSNITLIPHVADIGSKKILDFQSGVTIEGKVTLKALTNPDGTLGWSSIGGEVIWDLSDGSLDSDSTYIGTLLGVIIGNVSFSVSDVKATYELGNSKVSFMPILDVRMDRSGNEAHTFLHVMEKSYYSITFMDHGIDTVRYYEENTVLTQDKCETPAGNNFNGWYLDSAFVNRYNYNMAVNDQSDGTVLYARYTYVVTLDNMNGTTYKLYVSQEDKGALLSEAELGTPIYEGYEFKGWCKDKDLIYDWGYQTDRVDRDITLYARWQGQDVRVYFWYMTAEGLKLFTDESLESGKEIGVIANEDGQYDLSWAYQLNDERNTYPTVRWGSTFDVKDSNHGGTNILDYAKEKISEDVDLTGTFVRWVTKAPSGYNMSIYNDTTVGSNSLNYVSESYIDERYQGSYWKYYVAYYNAEENNSPYKRVPVWPSDHGEEPDSLEIHLFAETTNIAIKVSMGLKTEDQKIASTVTIDDPQEFLVYPNGPIKDDTKTIVEDEFGNKYTKVTEGLDTYYLRDNGVKYYEDSVENCWYCVDDSGGRYYEFAYKLNKAVRSGYILTGWHNDYISSVRTMNPSADLVRYVHITVDGSGYANTAKLISKDSEGYEIEIPLLVGNYVVDGLEADSEGSIYIFYEQQTPESYNAVAKSNGVEVKRQNGLHEGDTFVLPSPGTISGYEFKGWQVKNEVYDIGYEYEIKGSDSVDGGSIIFTAIWELISTYTVTLYDDDEVYERHYEVRLGSEIILNSLFKEDDNFLGWKAKSGMVGDSYKVSVRDIVIVSETEEIRLDAIWSSGTIPETYDVVFVTDHGIAPSSVTGQSEEAHVVLPVITDDGTGESPDEYKHIGWRIITGSGQHTVMKGSSEHPYTYILGGNDADGQHEIIMEAVWSKIYTVKIQTGTGTFSSERYEEGYVVDLDFGSHDPWYVLGDAIVQGSKLTPGAGEPLTLTYRANWDRLEYSIHLEQPANGHIDFYRVNSDGTTTYYPASSVNSTVFYYGDEIKLIYTPDTSKVAFIKWVFSGQYTAEDIYSNSTILVIQGEMSIFAEESTSKVIDIMISFDDKAQDPVERNYTRVYMHDKTAGDDAGYTQAKFVPGMKIYDHYVVKVPYGDKYEVCLEYDWELEDLEEVVQTYTERYALVGDLVIDSTSPTTLNYVVISAGFIDAIGEDITTFADTEYGPITKGTVSEEIFEFLFTEDEHGTVTINEDAKSSTEPGVYQYVPAPVGAVRGYPIVMYKADTKEVVAKVTKYVGILEDPNLNSIAEQGMNINNPEGETPPVVISFGPNIKYSTYEGFPWEDSDKHPVFAIATGINLAIDTESNSSPNKTFYLNWVRDDSPADIIIQIEEIDLSAYVKVDIRKETDDSTGSDYDDIQVGVKYESSGSGKQYPILEIEGYTPELTIKDGSSAPIPGEEVQIIDGKLSVKSDRKVLQYYLSYKKDHAYYSWADETIGHTGIYYDPPKSNDDQSWGTWIELPDKFYDSGGEHKVERWKVFNPVGEGCYVIKDESEKFMYRFLKSDALDTRSDSRLEFIPFDRTDTITLSFSTQYRSFENGNQRLDIVVTAGGNIKQYVDNLLAMDLVTDFIDLYGSGGAEYETGIYKFNGFKCNGYTFDKNDDETIVNDDMFFIADWTPNNNNKKVIKVGLEGQDATISVIKNSFSDDSNQKIGAPNYLLKDTEVTVTINPASGYTIDMDRIRGELGYSYIGSQTYVDLTVSGSYDGNTTAWKLWGNGFATQEGSKHTEDVNNAVNGFLVYVDGSSSGDGYKVVFVSGDEMNKNLVFKNAEETIEFEGETWLLWNTTTSFTDSYTVKDSHAVNGFIILVADDFELEGCTVVYASSDHKVNGAENYTPYYKDGNGSKYEKENVSDVYRYENSSWVHYKVTDLTGKDGIFVKQLSTESIAYKITRNGTFYSGSTVSYTVASYSGEEDFVKTISGAGKIYYVDSDGALYLENDDEYVPANKTFFTDAYLTNKVVNPAEATTPVYSSSADFTECPEQFGFYVDKPGTKLYGSDYECKDLSPLHHTLTNIGGSQYKDNYGSVWTKDSQGVLSLRSVTAYHLVGNTEYSETITYSGTNPLPAGYYMKDQYGNHIVPNSADFLYSQLYLKIGDISKGLTVKYVDLDEYEKSLYDGSVLVYHVKKNGTIVNLSGKLVDGALYTNASCTEIYRYNGDYIIDTVSISYNTLTSYTEGSKSYYEDTFGNKYEDWLGSPTKLPNNRGYMWTFFLKDDLDLTIYTKKISYNIYFILNGTRVGVSDANKVSTISSKQAGSQTYYGADIPEYTIVAFDGPSSNRDIIWYVDPAYSTEYDIHNGAVLLDPDKFKVDVTIADEIEVLGHEFSQWKLWGTTGYASGQNVSDLNGAGTHKGDSNNYFYVLTADWDGETPSAGYKIVLASQYGSLQGNLLYSSEHPTVDFHQFQLTSPGKELKGWKVWNTGNLISTTGTYTVDAGDVKDEFILLVADWGEDITNANNVIYASEYGSVPNMEPIRKYQFLADQNLSLYGYTGMYVVYLHGFSDDKESEDYQEPIMYSLLADEDDMITIPLEYFPLGDYKFIGWSAYTQAGKRVYTYAPGESIRISAISEHLDLYPFYIDDGSTVKYYDGVNVELKVKLDDKLKGAQVDPLDPGNTIMWVRYSHDGPIIGIDGMDQGPLEATHAGEYEVYYYARIMTPGGLGDKSHGNTLPYYQFPGETTLKILQVDAYVIAPSANIRADPDPIHEPNLGKIVVNSSLDAISSVLKSDPNNTIITSDDIKLIGINNSDVSSKALEMDGSVISATVELMYPGEKTISAVIHFADEEAALKDYRITYIDGSLAIYPEDSSKHEHTEYA